METVLCLPVQGNNISNNTAEVWIGGEKVKDVTTHPAFQSGVRSLAALNDSSISSSLMGLPTEADFAAEIFPELEKYLATDSTSARDRVQLFHLAWDVACSAFGGRQTLYERFFGGDPVRNTMLLYQGYNKRPPMDRVQQFLEQEG